MRCVAWLVAAAVVSVGLADNAHSIAGTFTASLPVANEGVMILDWEIVPVCNVGSEEFFRMDITRSSGGIGSALTTHPTYLRESPVEQRALFAPEDTREVQTAKLALVAASGLNFDENAKGLSVHRLARAATDSAATLAVCSDETLDLSADDVHTLISTSQGVSETGIPVPKLDVAQVEDALRLGIPNHRDNLTPVAAPTKLQSLAAHFKTAAEKSSVDTTELLEEWEPSADDVDEDGALSDEFDALADDSDDDDDADLDEDNDGGSDPELDAEAAEREERLAQTIGSDNLTPQQLSIMESAQRRGDAVVTKAARLLMRSMDHWKQMEARKKAVENALYNSEKEVEDFKRKIKLEKQAVEGIRNGWGHLQEEGVAVQHLMDKAPMFKNQYANFAKQNQEMHSKAKGLFDSVARGRHAMKTRKVPEAFKLREGVRRGSETIANNMKAAHVAAE
mmetsp:Transcript_32082/g.69294  ORF Transcript_32082/g.69294 Transcript_32082/m.69294 type:complete len:452 (+) Transcript_32082:1-1356(+)